MVAPNGSPPSSDCIDQHQPDLVVLTEYRSDYLAELRTRPEEDRSSQRHHHQPPSQGQRHPCRV